MVTRLNSPLLSYGRRPNSKKTVARAPSSLALAIAIREANGIELVKGK